MSRVLAIVAGCTFLLSLALAAPVPPGAKRPALYFPTRVGTKWVYQYPKPFGEVTELITESKAEKGVTTVTVETLEDDGERKLWEKVAVSDEGLSVVQDMFLSPSNPPIRWVKAGAKVGERWKIDTWSTTGESHIPQVGWVTAGGVERVEVPAGVFQAVRMEARGTDLGKWSQERWYAPGDGLVKWVNRAHEVIVLKSFTPGKD